MKIESVVSSVKLPSEEEPAMGKKLTDEIIAGILSRLPVTSLYRFKCVSKPWRSLISDPHFIKTHLNCHNKYERVFLVSEYCDFYSVDVESSLIGEESESEAAHLKFPPPQNPNNCHSNNDYADCAHNVVSVYSLSTGSWRRIGDSPYDHSLIVTEPLSSGIFVSGALHWVAISVTGSNETTVIASLDLAYENFRDVPCPPSVVDSFPVQGLELGVLGGCLCVLIGRFSSSGDVWMMKEYGVRDSWTKFTITFGTSHFWKPLCLSRTGEALLEMDGHTLALFNPRNDNCKELVVQGCPTFIEAAGTYVESLVSPNCSNLIIRQYQVSHT